jgi:hypothetical protein
MSTALPALMPMVSDPKKKADGSAYGPDDREFYHLAGADGGVRRYRYEPYPKALYRATRSTETGKVDVAMTIAQSERHADELLPQGWVMGGPDKAKDAFELIEQAQGQAAAELAHSVLTRGSEKAKRDYTKKSAETDTHLTE